MMTLDVHPEEAVRVLNERIDAIGTIARTPGCLDCYDVVGGGPAKILPAFMKMAASPQVRWCRPGTFG